MKYAVVLHATLLDIDESCCPILRNGRPASSVTRFLLEPLNQLIN